MKFLSTILAIVPSLLVSVLAQNSSCGCAVNTTYTDPTYHYYILNRYISMWEGNFSLLDTVVSPNVGYYQDQFPVRGNVPIYSSAELLGFMKQSRNAWDSFSFGWQYWISQGYKIAFRYTFEGIIGNATMHYPTATAKPGTHINYNGTDFYLLNPCTGLIDEVDSQISSIDYFDELGAPSIALKQGGSGAR